MTSSEGSAPTDPVASALVAGRPGEHAIASALREVQRRLFPQTVQRVGRYVLLGELGRGGMGVVFRAYDPELDRKVAVKLVTDRGAPAALRREAQALAKLSHRNVVPVYDVGELDDRSGVYIVMELIEGETLSTWLTTGTRRVGEITAMFVKAARGLAAAHAAGIVHRDFKPANVVVDTEGEPRVLDFGIAVASGSDDGGEIAVGTRPFMSPEQLRGGPIDARSDQYALSVALYQAIGGEYPFVGSDVAEQLQAKLRGVPTPMRRRCPARLQTALGRGLRPDPEQRFASLAEWIAAVDDAGHRRRRLRWAVAATAGLAIAGVVAMRVRHTEQRRACRTDATVDAWGDAQRESWRARLVAAHGEDGARAFAITDGDLSLVRDAIIEARASSCEAGVDGQIGDAARAARDACIDAIADELAAFTEVLTQTTALQATAELFAMPDASRCREPPEGSESADDVHRFARTFGAFEAMLRLGHYGEAEALLAAEADALSRAAPSVRVRADLLRAKLWRHRGDATHATKLAFDALRVADAESLPTLATQAMLRLADALAVGAATDVSRHDEAERWLTLARERLAEGEAPAWAVDFAAAERVDLLRKRGGDEAIAAARELLALRTARLGENHPATTTARDVLGATLTEAGRYAEGRVELEAALAARSAQLGPDHPSVARSLNNVAMNYLLHGSPAEAAERMGRALEIDERNGEVGSRYWLQRATNRLDAANRAGSGDPVAWGREAAAELAAMPCDDLDCAALHLQLADALVARDAPDAALAELGAVLAVLDGLSSVGEPFVRKVDALLVRALHPDAPWSDAAD